MFSKQMANPPPTHREKWRPTPCQPSKGHHMVHAPGLWLLASCAPAPESSSSRDLDPPHMEHSPLSQRPCNPAIMDTERDQRTEKILDLTLEILYLLTGEGHVVVKNENESSEHSNVADGSYRPDTDHPLPSPLLDQKILELTNQIIRLLTGETSRDLDPSHMEHSPLSQRPCNLGIMDTARDQRTEKILDLTLEILHLLTGEGQMVVKKTNESAEHRDGPHDLLPSSAVKQKILELSNQITRLLTGEVPIRCEDWEYVERHKDVVMADHQPLALLASEFGTEDENKADDGGKYMKSGETADEHSESLTHLTQNPIDSAPTDSACADSEEQSASYAGGKLPSAVTKTDGKSPLTHIKEAVREVFSMDTHSPEAKPNGLDRPQSCKGDSSDPSEATICESESLNEEKEDLPEKPFLCTECGKRYSHRQTLHKHKKHHRGDYIYNCSECGRGFNQSSRFVSHQFSHLGVKPFSCVCCGKGFKTESSAVAHQRIHTGEKPFKCSECEKCFHTKHYLTLHQRIHMEEKPFQCDVCGKSFKIKQSLKRHQTVHSSQTAFICGDCGRGFKHHSGLVSHQRVHTGEHPFECKECDRSYSSKSGLVYHSLSHKVEKAFQCDECGKCFAMKQALVLHQRIHTGEKPFSCPECGKCFVQYSHLVVHERNHRGEKPFICPECGKGFSCKGYLTSHQIVHTGEKRFKCNECGKCYTRRFGLIGHQKTHANNLNI